MLIYASINRTYAREPTLFLLPQATNNVAYASLQL